MNQELEFAKTLEKVRKLASEQGNCISEEQVAEAFRDLNLQKEQLELVYDYLKKKKIGIGEPVNPDDYLSEEEINYLETYLESLEALEEVTEGVKEAITLSAMAGDVSAKQKLIEIYLPQVVDIAKLYAGQGVFLEDLIGEGNVALTMAVEMLDCAANATEAQGTLGSMIMEAMENYIAENTEQKETGGRLAEEANKILEPAKELAESLGRKVTVSELAAETGMDEEIIRDAIRISADQIEYLDSKGER